MGQQSSTFDSGKERYEPHSGALETAHLARRARRDDYRELQSLFNLIVPAYVANRSMACLIAMNPDADSLTRSHKHTPNNSLWAIETEKATEAALRDRIDLQRAWFDMAQGLPVKQGIAVEVITRCGRIYRSRGIEPSAWYRPSAKRARYGRTAN